MFKGISVSLKTISLITFLLLTTQSQAAVVKSASGDPLDVRNAIAKAGSNGTVLIPKGEFIFNDSIVVENGVHIKGAGKGKTVLYRTDTSIVKAFFKFTYKDQKPFKFSDMTLRGLGTELFKNGGSEMLDVGLRIQGPAQNFVIYNSHFEGFSNTAILIFSESLYPNIETKHPTGVISNNDFSKLYYSDGVKAFGYGVAVYGDNSNSPIDLGSANAVFVENNKFDRCRHTIASNRSARYVFRHNIISNNYAPYAAVDAHGKTGSFNGTKSFEIYNNLIEGGLKFDGTVINTWAIGIRGGDGVIHNNVFTGLSQPIYLVVDNITVLSGEPYPIPGQTTDLYLWNNYSNGTNSEVQLKFGWSAIEELNKPYFEEGRDYYYTEKPEYVAYTYPHPLAPKINKNER